MAKAKTLFVCQNCGAKRAKWEGRCTDCGQWNTLVEEQSVSERKGWVKSGSSSGRNARMDVYNLIDSPSLDSGERTTIGIGEVDRVLGGGLVKGSYILLGGDPGIGKSTLVMQIAGHLGRRKMPVLYVSAEESVQQTALRARRLGLGGESVELASESSIDAIIETTLARQPALLIVDSIQTVFTSDVESAPGSVSQVRECAARLLSLAKNKNVTVVLIGHVTKDGSLAGPRVLEHMVDTVLSFEGDHHQQFRLLRALKNRFGATNELGVFQMANEGLQEVPNPSEFFLEQRAENRFGSSVFAAMEGSRPMLCEIQALSHSTPLPSPRRTAIGIDINRVHMLAAVLEKHTSISLTHRDVYANVVGGLRITEPAADLALVAAIISSELQVPLPAGSCFFGEIGLTGEIRGAHMALERVKEAAKLGFTKIFLPASNQKYLFAGGGSGDAGARGSGVKAFPGVEFIWLREVSELETKLAGGVGRRGRSRTRASRYELDFDV